MHWIDNQFFSVCQSVSQSVERCANSGFEFDWVMWLRRRLLFARQTRSSLPILEMCGFRFLQFSGSGEHIFQQISTKSHIQIKLSNAAFVFNGK